MHSVLDGISRYNAMYLKPTIKAKYLYYRSDWQIYEHNKIWMHFRCTGALWLCDGKNKTCWAALPASRVMASHPISNSFVTFQWWPFVFCVCQANLMVCLRNGTATGTTHTIHGNCEWSIVCWFYHAICGDWMPTWMTWRVANRQKRIKRNT